MSPPTDLDPLCITEKGAQECQNRVEKNIALGFSKKVGRTIILIIILKTIIMVRRSKIVAQ